MTVRDWPRRLQEYRAQFPDAPCIRYLDGIARPGFDACILLEIPSFCDRELPDTIRSALLQAANPERVHFAVCLQDDDPARLEFLKSTPNCRFRHFDPEHSPGTCAARNICQGMLEDETWVMHLDSHMRFSPGWDIALPELWRECGDPRAVLTEYSCGWDPEHPAPDDPKLAAASPGDSCFVVHPGWRSGCMFRHQSCAVPSDRNLPVPCSSANTFFAPAEADREVRFDPQMYHIGDESAMDIRLWTHGWNLYAPRMHFVWHLYGTRQERRFGPMPETASGRRKDREEQLRFSRLAGIPQRDAPDLGGFGPGQARTLESWQRASGMLPDMRHVRAFGHAGHFSGELLAEDLAVHTLADEQSADRTDAGRRERSLPPPASAPARALRRILESPFRLMPDSPLLQQLLELEHPDLTSPLLLTAPPEPALIRSARLQAAAPARIFVQGAPRPGETGLPENALRLDIPPGSRFACGWDAALLAGASLSSVVLQRPDWPETDLRLTLDTDPGLETEPEMKHETEKEAGR